MEEAVNLSYDRLRNVDGEVEEVVTRWLTTQDANLCQQGTCKLVPRCD